MQRKAVLVVSARDRTGIVASLSDMVFRYGGNVLDADQHSDEESEMFFMRLAWDLEGFSLDKKSTEGALSVLARGFEGMQWKLWYDHAPQNIAVFCSQTPHCLFDLLLREAMGELGGKITHVISNHTELKDTTEHFNKEFHYIPINADNKKEAEKKQIKILKSNDIDLVVLARYMQILSADFINTVGTDSIINIHHSFLPAFAGANPYRQAKKKGVKIIGATSHYVTEELDTGPIIEQDVARVTHKDSVQDLIRKGRDLERKVLSHSVRLHLQHRILIHKNRTIVFT